MKRCFSAIVFWLVPLLNYAADWPVPKAIKCQSSGTFHCLHTGKFEDPFDRTCTKYLLCSEFDNEKIQVELICPDNTFYDPVTEQCSSKYKCICDSDNSSITPVTTSATITAETINIYPDECTICSQCITKTSTIAKTLSETKSTPIESLSVTQTTQLSSKSISDIKTTTSNLSSFKTSSITLNLQSSEPTSISTATFFVTKTTQFSPESTRVTPNNYCSIEGTFTCNKTGRFFNPNDSTCNSYYYCYAWSDGRMDQYSYSCSIGLFNPEKEACDPSYVCPCLETTTSDIKTSSITSNLPSSEPTSITTEASSVTKTTHSISESTTVTPLYCSIGGTFTCNKTGRFVNPNDPTCNSYYYCYAWSDGRVDQYSYSCSVGLFNPDKGACDHSYICPCSETTTSERKTSSITSNLPSSEPTSITTEASSVTKTTHSISESTTVTPPYCSIGGMFTCNKTGRFFNPNDSTCNSYYYCYVWSDGRVDQYLYSCSVGLFNPGKGACDHSYICPCSKTTTSEIKTSSITSNLPSSEPTSISTETSTVTKTTQLSSETTTVPPPFCSIGGTFTCNKTGRFFNPNDSTCNSYYYCYVWSDGRVDQYLYSCSVGYFNPNKEACDPSYVCPCSEITTIELQTSLATSKLPPSYSTDSTSRITTKYTTTASTTTNSTVITPITKKTVSTTSTAFTCRYTGRFANQNDKTCKTYHYCLVYSNGRIRHSLNTCLIGRFNPNRSRCEVFYRCSF